VSGGGGATSESVRLFRHIYRDLAKFGRPVIHRVHRGEDSKKHLCRANVGGRLVATNVLFAGLQGQAIGGSTVSVTRDTDEPSGHLSFEALGHSEERRVGPAETERDTKALRRADDDFRTLRSGRDEQIESKQIAGNHDHTTDVLDGSDVSRDVADAPG
jgi:hypothetical protein